MDLSKIHSSNQYAQLLKAGWESISDVKNETMYWVKPPDYDTQYSHEEAYAKEFSDA